MLSINKKKNTFISLYNNILFTPLLTLEILIIEYFKTPTHSRITRTDPPPPPPPYCFNYFF